jgi:hypothetical protein
MRSSQCERRDETGQAAADDPKRKATKWQCDSVSKGGRKKDACPDQDSREKKEEKGKLKRKTTHSRKIREGEREVTAREESNGRQSNSVME